MEVHRVLLSDVLCLVLSDYSLLLEVYLVAHDYDRCILILNLVDTLNPVRDGLVSLLTSQVEAKDDPIGLTIKLVSYVAELFLPRRVPNLHLNRAVILFIVIVHHDIVNGDCLQVIRNEFSLVKLP